MPDPTVIDVSPRTGEGIDAWVAWLEQREEVRLRWPFPVEEQPTR